jgi:hypothetical protein
MFENTKDHCPPHCRVYNCIEFSPLLLISKHDSTEFGAIERSVLFQNIRTKCGYDFVKCLGARTDNISSEDVGVDDWDVAGGQLPRNCRLSCSYATCEPYDYYMA